MKITKVSSSEVFDIYVSELLRKEAQASGITKALKNVIPGFGDITSFFDSKIRTNPIFDAASTPENRAKALEEIDRLLLAAGKLRPELQASVKKEIKEQWRRFIAGGSTDNMDIKSLKKFKDIDKKVNSFDDKAVDIAKSPSANSAKGQGNQAQQPQQSTQAPSGSNQAVQSPGQNQAPASAQKPSPGQSAQPAGVPGAGQVQSPGAQPAIQNAPRKFKVKKMMSSPRSGLAGAINNQNVSTLPQRSKYISATITAAKLVLIGIAGYITGMAIGSVFQKILNYNDQYFLALSEVKRLNSEARGLISSSSFDLDTSKFVAASNLADRYLDLLMSNNLADSSQQEIDKALLSLKNLFDEAANIVVQISNNASGNSQNLADIMLSICNNINLFFNILGRDINKLNDELPDEEYENPPPTIIGPGDVSGPSGGLGGGDAPIEPGPGDLPPGGEDDLGGPDNLAYSKDVYGVTLDISKYANNPGFISASSRIISRVMNSPLGRAFVDPQNHYGGMLGQKETPERTYLNYLLFFYRNNIDSTAKLRSFIRKNFSRVERGRGTGFKEALKKYR